MNDDFYLESLRIMGRDTIRELEVDNGILASSRQEIFGCIFGRDSLITGLKLLRSCRKNGNSHYLNLVRKILLNLASLQGRVVNIENGEEPGKIIHEYRPSGHEHLTKRAERPWYVHDDDSMRNYDSVDSTPLFLIAAYRYWEYSKDDQFLETMLPHVRQALDWMKTYGDGNGDGFIDYHFHPQRKFGGLSVQSWMDSSESLFHEDGQAAPYPIAPVEVQAYAYLALRLWARHFGTELDLAASDMKKRFNLTYICNDPAANNGCVIAAAIDGEGKQVLSVRSNPGHILWAAADEDCILEAQHIPKLVERLMSPDLFEPEAGVRTLSSQSSHFDPASYHNGSIWPHDNAMIIEGLDNFGYEREATRIREAMVLAWNHFGSPIELFTHDADGMKAYGSACKKQAWSAASIVAEL